MHCAFLSTILLFCFTVNAAFTVSGSFTDYISGDPIDSCLIVLNGLSPNTKTDSARSNGEGDYLFTDVPAGVYSLVVADNRYAPDTVSKTIESNQKVSFVLFELTHLLDSIPDTLYRERSPYLIRKNTVSYRSLTIMSGVTIRFIQKGTLYIDGGISAKGTMDDSIWFIADSINSDSGYNPSASISIFHVKNNSFNYCRFERISNVHANGFSYLAFENCLFSGMRTAVLFNRHDVSSNAAFTHSTIQNCYNGVADSWAMAGGTQYNMMASSLTLTDNIIWCTNVALCISVYQQAYVEHNTILGLSLLDMSQLKQTDTVENNIFSDIRFDNISGNMLFFAYNVLDSMWGASPLGVGTPALQNVNGDSCDFYFNIMKNPLIADSATGMLYEGSPCIGAASDGKNIGVYQGDAAGIEREYLGPTPSQPHRLFKMRFGQRTLFLPVDVHLAIPPGNYTFSLFTVQGKRVFESEGKVNGDENTFLVDNDGFLSIAPGKYLFRIDGLHCRFPGSLLIW